MAERGWPRAAQLPPRSLGALNGEPVTLIVTQISRFGIIHASDSNLTAVTGHPAGEAPKTFAVPHLNAALTVAGSYAVGTRQMDDWMRGFIANEGARGNRSLSAFAGLLRDAVQGQMTTEQRQGGCIMHIAGYAAKDGSFAPEFYHLRNSHGMDPNTGEYTFGDQFVLDEDFATTYLKRADFGPRFEAGIPMLYASGFPAGRVGFFALHNALSQFFSGIWSQLRWQFRPPRTLEEAADFVRLYLQIIATLFRSSDYGAPLIGGTVQLYGIPAPPAPAKWFS